jgi:hypothetical protein
MGKDMLMTCPEGDNALSCAHAAIVVAAADNALLDPAHAVTLGGNRGCRNAGLAVHPSPRTPHNNRAAGTSVRKNLPPGMLGAGPRGPAPPQLPPWPARAAAAGNAAPVRSDAPAPVLSHASVDWPDNAATAAPPADTPRGNNGSADAAEQTTLRSPSKDTVVVARDQALVLAQNRLDTEVAPRECRLPGSSLEEEMTAPLRGAFIAPSAVTSA